MNNLLLTHERLDVGAINELVAHDTCGAISLFVGTTRNNFESKKVLSLQYEAYEPMALKQMQAICEELRARWVDIANVAIYHRLGEVPVREASVVIAISTPHRQSSLDAVAFAIEELKRRVPIWKKEHYDDNESAWKENKESPTAKRLKRPKLNFANCTLECDKLEAVPRSLVQIAAAEHEIHRRIECFVQKKREEIDLHNIMDYTVVKSRGNDSNTDATEDWSTCARTDSIIVKQEHSKCHLRVRRVQNRSGPQTRPDYLNALDKLMSAKTSTNTALVAKIKQEPMDNDTTNVDRVGQPQKLSDALEERFTNIEQHLGVSAVVVNTIHVHERLKAIENRILHLESISPEYKHFILDKTTTQINPEERQQQRIHNTEYHRKRKIFTADELDGIIGQMQQQKISDSDRDEEQRDSSQ